MKRAYRGETSSKKVSRAFVWQQHKRVLGSSFSRTPHVFLASKVAGDVNTLRAMRVSDDLIWAVEDDEAEYRPLLDKKPSHRLFPRRVETVIEEYVTGSGIRSVYLDFCGNLEGEEMAIRRVVSVMPRNSVVSITLFLGRELRTSGDREAALWRLLREHSKHKVSLVQRVLYQSDDTKSSGSPMGIWTFALGGLVSSRSKMRFDIRPSTLDVKTLANSPVEIKAMWQKEVSRSERQSLAAVKANQTRL